MPRRHILIFIAVPANATSTQRSFVSALLDPALPVPSGIAGQAEKRYAIYRNNVTVSLVRALESNFPAIRKLLGETYFAGLAREFAQHHPPTTPLLFMYGDAFATYLASQQDLENYPYLSDVAKLEQLWRLSYHEQDADPLAPETFTALDEDALMNLRLKPHPAMALLSSAFAVHSIFKANRGDETPNSIHIAQSEFVLLTRPYFEVVTQSIAEGTFVFFSKLAEGESFGNAADAAFAVDDALDLTHCISILLTSGAFQSLQNQD
jgi:hypothetical protein